MELTNLPKAELISHTAELLSDRDTEVAQLKQERRVLAIALGVVVALSSLL